MTLLASARLTKTKDKFVVELVVNVTYCSGKRHAARLTKKRLEIQFKSERFASSSMIILKVLVFWEWVLQVPSRKTFCVMKRLIVPHRRWWKWSRLWTWHAFTGGIGEGDRERCQTCIRGVESIFAVRDWYWANREISSIALYVFTNHRRFRNRSINCRWAGISVVKHTLEDLGQDMYDTDNSDISSFYGAPRFDWDDRVMIQRSSSERIQQVCQPVYCVLWSGSSSRLRVVADRSTKACTSKRASLCFGVPSCHHERLK